MTVDVVMVSLFVFVMMCHVFIAFCKDTKVELPLRSESEVI